MPAFTVSKMVQLNQNIKKLAENMVNSYTFDLTHEDYLNLFVDPADRDVFLRAGKLCKVSRWNNFEARWDISDESCVGIDFHLNNTDIPAPLVVNVRREAAPTAAAKIDNWLEWRRTVGLNFGLVELVLAKLNARCTSVAQVRFFWPSIVTLCGMHETTALADGVVGAPSKVPHLEVPLRQACREASGTIAGASLIGTPESSMQPVSLSLDDASRRSLRKATKLGLVDCL